MDWTGTERRTLIGPRFRSPQSHRAHDYVAILARPEKGQKNLPVLKLSILFRGSGHEHMADFNSVISELDG